ncbi:hypothetical protein LIER_21466 [Lithospermum erythrorhizon]|uniref:Uncharacterized protein n=1 Tax=Lithospermum erythrorhizon TaxID=34254 RepID=A0AAV3QTT0_LITER
MEHGDLEIWRFQNGICSEKSAIDATLLMDDDERDNNYRHIHAYLVESLNGYGCTLTRGHGTPTWLCLDERPWTRAFILSFNHFNTKFAPHDSRTHHVSSLTVELCPRSHAVHI